LSALAGTWLKRYIAAGSSQELGILHALQSDSFGMHSAPSLRRPFPKKLPVLDEDSTDSRIWIGPPNSLHRFQESTFHPIFVIE
jgi:hypothetical protein